MAISRIYRLMKGLSCASCCVANAPAGRELRVSSSNPGHLRQNQGQKATGFRGVDISAAIRATEWLCGIGDIRRPRQEAVNLFSRTPHEGSRTTPPRTPSPQPKLAVSSVGSARSSPYKLQRESGAADVPTRRKRAFGTRRVMRGVTCGTQKAGR